MCEGGRSRQTRKKGQEQVPIVIAGLSVSPMGMPLPANEPPSIKSRVKQGGRESKPNKGEKKARASGAARRRPRAATSAHERARKKTEALTKRLSPACSERRGCGRTKTSYAACAANTARDFGCARSAGLARKSWSSRRASRPACRTWT